MGRDRPTQLYHNDIAGIESGIKSGLIGNEQKVQIFDAFLRYIDGDFEHRPTDPVAAMAVEALRLELSRRADEYDKKCDKNRENGSKGGRPTKPNETEQNRTVLEETEQNPIINDTILNEIKFPPIAPQGARIGGGGNKFSFKEFAKEVEKAEKTVLAFYDDEGTPIFNNDIGLTQVVWRYLDFGGQYAKIIGGLVAEGLRGASLKSRILDINGKYPPKTDFQALTLARAMMAMNNPGAAVACANEVDAHQDEPGIYKTMLEKVEYIQRGNKVSSYPGFFKTRQQS